MRIVFYWTILTLGAVHHSSLSCRESGVTYGEPATSVSVPTPVDPRE